MTERGLRLAIAVLAAASLAYGVVSLTRDLDRHELFWDLGYYQKAAARWLAGDDPYLEDGEPTGYYHRRTTTPLVARAFDGFEVRTFAGVPATTAYGAIAAVGILAALALALAAVRPPPPLLPLAALYALAFGNFEALYAFGSGNLAWLGALCQAGAFLAAARRRWPAFYLLVGVATVLKPYSLALLVVPWLLARTPASRAPAGAPPPGEAGDPSGQRRPAAHPPGSWWPTHLPWVGVALAPTLVDLLVGAWLWPHLAASRLEAIRLGVVEPLQLRYSLTGRLSRELAGAGLLEPLPATAVAFAVQLAVAAGIVLLLRRRLRAAAGTAGGAGAAIPGEPMAGAALPLALLAAYAFIPRLAGYDAYAFGAAVFAAFWPRPPGRGLAAADLLPAVALVFGLLKEGEALLPVVTLLVLLAGRGRLPSPSGSRPGG